MTQENSMQNNSPHLNIGTLVQLKCECLDNPEGTVGIVYQVYERGAAPHDHADRYGIAVIFPNGQHDGFSPYERDTFLAVIGLATDSAVRNYQFKHITQLRLDYGNGLFTKAFGEGLLLKVGAP